MGKNKSTNQSKAPVKKQSNCKKLIIMGIVMISIVTIGYLKNLYYLLHDSYLK